MRFRLAVFLFLLSIFGVGHWADAEVNLNVTYDYFPVPYVRGMPVKEMIARSSPLRAENGVHVSVGRASWTIGYASASFSQPLVDVCQIENPNIVCPCNITLPRLEGGDATTKAQFEAEVARTLKHEMQHCNIALSHARTLESRVLKIGKKSCDKIRDEMKKELDTVYAECRRDQKQFDVNEYGYNHYLRIESMQSMIDSGATYISPPSGYGAPVLDTKKRKLEVLEQDAEQLSKDGIYKDKNGVWRNY